MRGRLEQLGVENQQDEQDQHSDNAVRDEFLLLSPASVRLERRTGVSSVAMCA